MYKSSCLFFLFFLSACKVEFRPHEIDQVKVLVIEAEQERFPDLKVGVDLKGIQVEKMERVRGYYYLKARYDFYLQGQLMDYKSRTLVMKISKWGKKSFGRKYPITEDDEK